MAKNVDFWSGEGVEFEPTLALDILAARLENECSKNARFLLKAPRISLALQTKPRSSDTRPESSVFQAWKGCAEVDLDSAGVTIAEDGRSVVIVGFADSADGVAALDRVLCEGGALTRDTVSRVKGWGALVVGTLALVKTIPTGSRVSEHPGAKQWSLAVPKELNAALPSGFSVKYALSIGVACGQRGITLADLEAWLLSFPLKDDNTANNNNTAFPTTANNNTND